VKPTTFVETKTAQDETSFSAYNPSAFAICFLQASAKIFPTL
jgi:hypothetical protein